jgi:SAM-dependent methyltransferase
VEPEFPHDDLTFEELGARYNYDLTSDRRRILVRLLIKECGKRQHPIRALDIGCGTGISEEEGVNAEYLRAFRAHVDELWGVEPDESVTPTHGLIDHFQHATLEAAKLPENYFDIAYSYFVMEHVENPALFLQHVFRCLRPGGVYIFITPNGRHYFTKIAKFLKAVHLDELILRLVRGKSVAGYHYPVQYRVNTPRQIDRLASEQKFERPEYAFIERGGPRPYFRGPFLVIYFTLVWKRRIYRSSKVLLELICRLKKPQHS